MTNVTWSQKTWNILCTPFLIILSFHQTRSGPIVYIDRKQQRKSPVFIEKKKKKLALTTFEGGGQLWGLSGLSVRGVVGVKLYWHHTYILNGAAMGKERERERNNWTKPHSFDVCDDLSENSVMSRHSPPAKQTFDWGLLLCAFGWANGCQIFVVLPCSFLHGSSHCW